MVASDSLAGRARVPDQPRDARHPRARIGALAALRAGVRRASSSPPATAQIIPPMIEDLGVFTRIGDATDVVTKEMYDFVDKGGRHVALRPEQTASVCRAFVEHRPPTPWKAWYSGPNFRYEKPQRGRYRQFDQVGIEVLGADDPYLDVEVIALGWEFYRRLGLRQVDAPAQQPRRARRPGPLRRRAAAPLRGRRRRAVRAESRDARQEPAARARLQACRRTRRSIAAAPTIDRVLVGRGGGALRDRVHDGLTALGIPFTIDPRLVRGLDYYRRTTFEFQGGTLDSAPERARRRWPLRRPGRGPRRPADARHRFRARRRPHAARLRRRGRVRRARRSRRRVRRRHHRRPRGAR